MVACSETALRLGRADADLWSAWLQALAALPGDPYRAELRRFNETTALLVHGVPIAYYNRVLMRDAPDPEVVDDIASFYGERLTPCRIDVNPYAANSDLLDALDSADFRPAAFQSNLFGRVVIVEDEPPPQVSVTEVCAGEIEFFADFYNRAYYHGQRIPKGLMSFRAATISARHGRPGWRMYLCRVDGIPASGAILYTNDGVATLTGAATIPAFRGRGCQRALLRARLNDAARSGCDLVVSRCGVGSPSQRNLERAGLQTGYTKVIWEQRGLASSSLRTASAESRPRSDRALRAPLREPRTTEPGRPVRQRRLPRASSRETRRTPERSRRAPAADASA